ARRTRGHPVRRSRPRRPDAGRDGAADGRADRGGPDADGDGGADLRVRRPSRRRGARQGPVHHRCGGGTIMRRVVLQAWVLFWLMLVWILLWGTVSAANIISGLAVALVITLLLPLPVVPIEGRVHPVSLCRLIGL